MASTVHPLPVGKVMVVWGFDCKLDVTYVASRSWDSYPYNPFCKKVFDEEREEIKMVRNRLVVVDMRNNIAQCM
jgi:hypothetical protein